MYGVKYFFLLFFSYNSIDELIFTGLDLTVVVL